MYACQYYHSTLTLIIVLSGIEIVYYSQIIISTCHVQTNKLCNMPNATNNITLTYHNHTSEALCDPLL